MKLEKMYGQWKTSDLKKKVPILWFLCSRANIFYNTVFLLITHLGFHRCEKEKGAG